MVGVCIFLAFYMIGAGVFYADNDNIRDAPVLSRFVVSCFWGIGLVYHLAHWVVEKDNEEENVDG